MKIDSKEVLKGYSHPFLFSYNLTMTIPINTTEKNRNNSSIMFNRLSHPYIKMRIVIFFNFLMRFS